MGDLLGLGITHAPQFQFPDQNMADILRMRMRNEALPAEVRNPRNWPAAMQAEWGDDEGLSSAKRHRAELVKGFRAAREALDAFRPDFVLIFGDDQYENFKEDLVPPFCVYALDEAVTRPFATTYASLAATNVWDEPPDKVVPVKGHRDAGNYLARRLIQSGFDVAYSYKLHHADCLNHAFVRTLLYLDYEQRGWDYPLVPFHVNCYGSDLTAPQFIVEGKSVELRSEESLPPPAPSPWRCYDLGKSLADILRESPWRVAVIGSSSWSHAFLTSKFPWGCPDVEADLQILRQLKDGRQAEWRDMDLTELRASGQHEFLNWICLAGAMEGRRPEVVAYSESYIFNSDKCVTLFPVPEEQY